MGEHSGTSVSYLLLQRSVNVSRLGKNGRKMRIRRPRRTFNVIWTEKDKGTGQQAVLVRIRLSNNRCGDRRDEWSIAGLDEKLRHAVETSGVGEVDGHEWGGGYFTSYLYGPDADRLFEAVSLAVLQYPAPAGSYVVKRYGGVGAVMQVVRL